MSSYPNRKIEDASSVAYEKPKSNVSKDKTKDSLSTVDTSISNGICSSEGQLVLGDIFLNEVRNDIDIWTEYTIIFHDARK